MGRKLFGFLGVLEPDGPALFSIDNFPELADRKRFCDLLNL